MKMNIPNIKHQHKWRRHGFSMLKVCLILLSYLLVGCILDEIPEIDETSPGFILRVTGPGVNATIDQDTDFENINLNLLADEVYNFSYLATDQGGVGYQELRIGPYDQFEFSDLSPALLINETSGLTRSLRQLGEATNPRTALSIGGNFISVNETSSDFIFTIRDFGGASGAPNQTNARLWVNIITDEDRLGIIELPRN